MALDLPHLGWGIGLRAEHTFEVLQEKPQVDWFEVLSENVMDSKGRARAMVDAIAEHYPLVLHGVSMNIGSSDPLDYAYLDRLAALAESLKPAWISDHLCFTSLGGHNSHDLLPMPYTEASLAHVVSRVREVQAHLGRVLVLENPSTYVRFRHSTMEEWIFLARLAEQAECALLVDINNIAVSAFNHGWDPHVYLEALPKERIAQVHLAGHSDLGTHRIDTHDAPVCAEVWELYASFYEAIGGVSTLVEWDADLPPLRELVEEAMRARQLATQGVQPLSQGANTGARLSHPRPTRLRSAL